MPLIPSRFQVEPFLDVSQRVSHTPTPSTRFSQNLVRQPNSVSIILSIHYFFRYFTTLWTIKILFRVTLYWAEESSLNPTYRGPSPPPQTNNPIGPNPQSLSDRSSEYSQAPEPSQSSYQEAEEASNQIEFPVSRSPSDNEARPHDLFAQHQSRLEQFVNSLDTAEVLEEQFLVPSPIHITSTAEGIIRPRRLIALSYPQTVSADQSTFPISNLWSISPTSASPLFSRTINSDQPIYQTSYSLQGHLPLPLEVSLDTLRELPNRSTRLAYFLPISFSVNQTFGELSQGIRRTVPGDNHDTPMFNDYFENQVLQYLWTFKHFPLTTDTRQWIHLSTNACRIKSRTATSRAKKEITKMSSRCKTDICHVKWSK